jgi:hypothetical protein
MPDGQFRYAAVGTNGSQDVMLGLWPAAYAVAGAARVPPGPGSLV